MIFYHRTTEDAVRAILATGFRDAEGTYMTPEIHRGVWLSNVPLDAGHGCKGHELLEVDLHITEEEAEAFEWVEEDKPYREWLMPSELINARATVRRVPIEEEQDLQ